MKPKKRKKRLRIPKPWLGMLKHVMASDMPSKVRPLDEVPVNRGGKVSKKYA